MCMEKVFNDVMAAATVEVLALPIFRMVYMPENELLFWIVLLLLDSFMLKRLPFFEMLKLYGDPQYKKEQKQLLVVQVLFLVGLVIIAFHSLKLAGMLLLNDLIIEFLSFISAMNEKKNK